ncbi:MAG: ATP-grasp domain-containing protein [Tissierellales bacterium]|nr:ATP-grasp domain-containing protein [Tissierellales bacterium]MBN2826721.1 ATP-grasp domain-containing protein [Tissierellales bacterium]
MKFIVLGGGNCQLSLIKGLKKRGHEVILVDYLPNPIGKKIADFHETVSTFDVEGICSVVKKYNVAGIFTAGTDQPVLAGALASEKHGLSYYIPSSKAKELTHKRFMKDIFVKHHIPTVKHRYLQRDFSFADISGLQFPAVIKPFDSQGQRGVLKVNRPEDLRVMIGETFSFTEESEILIEEFYPNDEITVSGWVIEGHTHILSVTDRITYDTEPHIGICTAHHFPSKYYALHKTKIVELTKKIVSAFDIKSGPIYFQMLVGINGILVNETAARIGGAFEDVFINYLTGVDLHDLLINDVLKVKNHLLHDNYMDVTHQSLSVELFFARPGKIKSIKGINQMIQDNIIIDGAFNFLPGEIIGEIKNATERAGHFIVSANNIDELYSKLKYAYSNIEILDMEGHNLVILPNSIF